MKIFRLLLILLFLKCLEGNQKRLDKIIADYSKKISEDQIYFNNFMDSFQMESTEQVNAQEIEIKNYKINQQGEVKYKGVHVGAFRFAMFKSADATKSGDDIYAEFDVEMSYSGNVLITQQAKSVGNLYHNETQKEILFDLIEKNDMDEIDRKITGYFTSALREVIIQVLANVDSKFNLSKANFAQLRFQDTMDFLEDYINGKKIKETFVNPNTDLEQTNILHQDEERVIEAKCTARSNELQTKEKTFFQARCQWEDQTILVLEVSRVNELITKVSLNNQVQSFEFYYKQDLIEGDFGDQDDGTNRDQTYVDQLTKYLDEFFENSNDFKILTFETFKEIVVKRFDHLYLKRYDQEREEDDLFSEFCKIEEKQYNQYCKNCQNFQIQIQEKELKQIKGLEKIDSQKQEIEQRKLKDKEDKIYQKIEESKMSFGYSQYFQKQDRRLILSHCPLHQCQFTIHQISFYNVHYYLLQIICPQLRSTQYISYQKPEHTIEKIYNIIESVADDVYSWNKIKNYLENSDKQIEHKNQELKDYGKIIQEILKKEKFEFEIEQKKDKQGEINIFKRTSDHIKIIQIQKIMIEKHPYVDVKFFYPISNSANHNYVNEIQLSSDSYHFQHQNFKKHIQDFIERFKQTKTIYREEKLIKKIKIIQIIIIIQQTHFCACSLELKLCINQGNYH